MLRKNIVRPFKSAQKFEVLSMYVVRRFNFLRKNSLVHTRCLIKVGKNALHFSVLYVGEWLRTMTRVMMDHTQWTRFATFLGPVE